MMLTLRRQVLTTLAVLLALAVGIVLGGGPLSGVGRAAESTLPSSPSTGAGGPDAQDAARFADDFATAAAPTLYAGRLAGRPVSLLALPGASEATLTALDEQVVAAGGTVAGRYDATPALLAADGKSLVDTLGSQLVAQLGAGTVGDGATTYDRMGQLVGLAVANRTAAAAPVTDAGSVVRRALAGAELLTPVADDAATAPLVLVVLGQDTVDPILTGLLEGLAATSQAVVVAGDTASGADGDLAVVRSAPVGAALATVDGVETAPGRVSAVLALIQGATGSHGAFGASGAEGPAPLG